ncbi:MAG: hypothetical protein Kow00107_05200 [Planctomycetota bacterium]
MPLSQGEGPPAVRKPRKPSPHGRQAALRSPNSVRSNAHPASQVRHLNFPPTPQAESEDGQARPPRIPPERAQKRGGYEKDHGGGGSV